VRESLKNLKDQIDHQRDHSPLFFSSTLPEALLSYCTYLAGTSHATDQIATGDALEWHPNDVLKDHAVLLAYIKVEQLKLQRALESPAFHHALRNPPSEDLGDPEPFDEFTGPTGAAD